VCEGVCYKWGRWGPIYRLRWSRGFSIARSSIPVTPSLGPWIKQTLNHLKLTHRIAPKCASVFPCMCLKERRWSESGVLGGMAGASTGVPLWSGPSPLVWWPQGCSRVWVWTPFVHLSTQHTGWWINNPCDASFRPLIMHRLGINGGEGLEVCFLATSYGLVRWHWRCHAWSVA
jgi:hypothetical protein